MKTFKNVLLVALFFAAATVLGQTKLTGKVVDEMGEPLPGANVVVKGTSNGAATDFDGKFMLNASTESGVVVVSFVGYSNKQVSFSGASDLGTVQLEPSNVLGEVVIKGLIDVAKDRQTPVAVSTIKAAEIQEKLGSQEFPELLNNTPSVYATKSGGGFGDARINIRGFDQRNTAVLINGVPVNDMENGQVYWSNWAGLSDVTTAMQVQRGLGSSKLAISSVGGTINIITKSTDKKEGGSALVSFGNDNYLKTLATYSTGKNENGFAATFLFSRTAGDGYVNGTEFEAYNYFVGLGWEINEDHDLQFMLTGAPQVHNQRTGSFFNMATLGDYLKYGTKYNYNDGTLNGEEFGWRRNFYHKPVTSLNWNWDINENSTLTTSAYVSFGRGGGTGDIGRLGGNFASSSRFRDPANGLVEYDQIVAANSGQGGNFSSGYSYTNVPDFQTGTFIVNDDGLYSGPPRPWQDPADRLDGVERRNGFIRRASVNSHNWYGLLSNFNTELNENLTLDFGIDLRSYTGIHYRRIDNLLGADGYRDNDNVNQPFNVLTTEYSSDLSSLWNVFKSTDDEEKINYHNDGKVRWLGAFTQLEYKNDAISAFIQGALSNQGFKRIDYFNYLDSDPEQETDWQNILGGNIKGGINWNIDENHNVFANGGYYSKQPFFDAVFLNFVNDVNEDVVNEKVVGVELGYGYRTSRFSANVNLYRTEWRDRFVRIGYETDSEEGTAQLNGITQLHMGAELDFTYDVTEDVRLLGMFSYGDWTYQDNITGTAFDQDQNQIGNPIDLDVNNVRVGDSPQTTARLGFEIKPWKNVKFDLNQRFVDRLYSALVIEDDLDDSDVTELNPAIRLPGYSLTDLGFSYKLNLDKEKGQTLNFRLNVNNLWNEEYIAESATNYAVEPGDDTHRGINTDNKVFFGFGRTWNFSLRYNF
ncbi:carboxypeptidase-like regulatory domain-containing protein [Tenacibaculum tangerinum]|uniref:Carboxypeptidase-like regulatory domain-containing protein n=1 Tax=Tenacibaculum tangerinum TaxID=3038772 RepID=A0ABY8L3T9_9FLAO|nr:carboxypeptidase-like regulatory domain-containing protein [Tenacibaculum tangerinum]WGH74555.1 carboxypeptidase-like regulatory domain-containing protein [Tenacibaculum tangerinum]